MGATNHIRGLSTADKNELLFQRGINFNNLPAWQRRGLGVYWQDVEREGFNPATQLATTTSRRELVTDLKLPVREAYMQFVQDLLGE